jgi:tetratricopeptide (TPR) repeat protein
VNLEALRHWHGRVEHSVAQERIRGRVLAFTGIWFLVAGMLAALGFAAILAFSLMLVGGVGVLAGGLWLLRRIQVTQRLRVGDPRLQQHLQRFASAVSQRAGTFLAGGRRKGATAVARVTARASEVRQKKPAAADSQRQAHRLNELGAQLRREGNHEQAAEQHQAALAIVREVGDRRAEALTLNNLALALVHTGGVSVAVQHFEQAAAVLRELGDEEHEGQVIANVGFVRLRQGRDEDAASLLHAALDKLPPESSAYHKVEEQLRRAS